MDRAQRDPSPRHFPDVLLNGSAVSRSGLAEDREEEELLEIGEVGCHGESGA
jgi:hypothetical protein